MQRNNGVESLVTLLRTRNPAVAELASIMNRDPSDEFTIVFPEVFDYWYSNYDPIPIQLQIYLVQERAPYLPRLSTESHYEALRASRDHRRIRFDLSRTKYIGVLQILMLDSLGTFLHSMTGRRVRVDFNESIVSFLSTARFFTHFRDWGESEDEPPPPSIGPASHGLRTLIPMTRIAAGQDVAAAAGSLVTDMGLARFLEREHGLDNDLMRDFATDVVSEICQNITEHSRGRGAVLAHARPSRPEYSNRSKASDVPNIELAISDCGIGVRESLRRKYPERYEEASHIGVIRDVLSGKIPQPADETRGGILRARQYVDRFQGLIFIHSVCAKGSNRSEESHDLDRSWRFFPGTHVSILIPRHGGPAPRERGAE